LIFLAAGWAFSSGFSLPKVRVGGAVGFRIESKIGRLSLVFVLFDRMAGSIADSNPAEVDLYGNFKPIDIKCY
jgi:hypothetical protein